MPRWYGETIGFWDERHADHVDVEHHGWKVHAGFEYSNKMQTIEIYSPNRDASGKFLGLNHEAIFYDEDALVEPIRIVRNFDKLGDLTEGAPYVFIECVQTIYPINGKATPRDARQQVRVRAARHVRPAVGLPLGGVLRAEHGAARGRGHLQLRELGPLRLASAPVVS